jgi:hypothetical protein
MLQHVWDHFVDNHRKRDPVIDADPDVRGYDVRFNPIVYRSVRCHLADQPLNVIARMYSLQIARVVQMADLRMDNARNHLKIVRNPVAQLRWEVLPLRRVLAILHSKVRITGAPLSANDPRPTRSSHRPGRV